MFRGRVAHACTTCMCLHQYVSKGGGAAVIFGPRCCKTALLKRRQRPRESVRAKTPDLGMERNQGQDRNHRVSNQHPLTRPLSRRFSRAEVGDH